jgi:hypothetical protein
MAISKRLRFEILRRDNHTCRYCGRSAPDAVLHIDHVIPESLGGPTESSNLITACSHCNGGKTSSTPDQSIVADVNDKALQWAAAMAQAAEEASRDTSGRDDLYDAVRGAWPSYQQNRIPQDYTETLDQFVNAGLPRQVIVQMARTAAAKPKVYNRWAYFCGCCWAKVRELQTRAAEIVSVASSGDSSRDTAVMDEAERLELVNG